MAVYLVFTETVHDAELMQEYSKAAMASWGVPGIPTPKALSVDASPAVLEGSWPATQTVLIEFETEEDARAWYESEAYQAAAKIRHQAADTDVVILHGF